MKLYLQLWSLKEQCEKDFRGTLKKVAEMGYDGVEYAGFYGLEAADLRNYMDELGLTSLSAHVGMENLRSDLTNQLAYLKTLGAKYIVCPMTDMNDEEKALAYAEELSDIGAKCAEAGLPLLYHNHAHEFTGDPLPIELFFNNIEEESVMQQPDVYWIAKAGHDPMEYLKSNQDRIPVVHLKQMAGDGTMENVAADQGVIDFHEIVKLLPEAHFVYEQEHTKDDMVTDIQRSIKYIKAIN